MRTWSLVFLGIGACGPMFPDAQPTHPPAADPAPSGPPGGAADPWSGDPGSSGAPGDPADPYAAGGAASPAPGKPAPAPGKPAPAPVPARPGPAPAPGKPVPGLPADAQALLDAHNKVRAQHCAPALAWSPKLAQVAQQWANTLKSQGCKFGHSGGQYGENLAAGSTGSLDGKAVTDMWYDEIKQYAFPNGGFSMQTGHFTQVVWRETTQMGCATTTCRGMDTWVCEYDPPGNVDGMYRQNVLRPGCK